MDATLESVPPVLTLLVPTAFGIAGALAPRGRPLGAAAWATRVAIALVALLFFASLTLQRGSHPLWASGLAVRIDAVTLTMLAVVATLGFVIVRFSRTYLAGDPGLPRYERWLLATLAAATTLIITENLLVLALAWTATSFALHQLLTYYPDRKVALVAAHKKFLVSRLADGCLWAALFLVGREVGSLELDHLERWLESASVLPRSMHVACGFFVVAACLKSAQLPFHGWLLQVMEAPTPVSALLHAGIVNLGGFLMIRLAPLMARSPNAQLLLVVFGMTTTVLAALVMATRVSVKVALAWSTSAQMGFMLVECGLGAWDLALLHLAAHSFYKAHAFLGSGSAVDAWRTASLAPEPRPVRPRALALGLAIPWGVAAVVYLAMPRPSLGALAVSSSHAPFFLLLALSSSPGLARAAGRSTASLGAAIVKLAGVSALYVSGHLLAARLIPFSAGHSGAALGVASAGVLILFGVQACLEVRPGGRLARALHRWLFAGLYLDERFTRLTFWLWPPALPATGARPEVEIAASLEV